jgi:hypothetical protein
LFTESTLFARNKWTPGLNTPQKWAMWTDASNSFAGPNICFANKDLMDEVEDEMLPLKNISWTSSGYVFLDKQVLQISDFNTKFEQSLPLINTTGDTLTDFF